jgi:hypothetical protein
MRLWMTNPHIAVQRPGLSDIEYGLTNYNALFDDASRKLMIMGFLQTYKYVLTTLLLFIVAFVYFKLPVLQTMVRNALRGMGQFLHPLRFRQ